MAADVAYDSRPNGFNSYRTPSQNSCLVTTNTKLAGEVLAGSCKPFLERLYDRTNNPEDRGRAIELLTSLEIGKEVQQANSEAKHRELAATLISQRPKTAAPSVGRQKNGYCCRDPPQNIMFNPFETSYSVQYPIRPRPSVKAVRPSTAQNAYSAPRPEAGPTGRTLYTTQFHSKSQTNRSKPIRAGTASGNRNNNPHPTQEFLVWRYPRNNNPQALPIAQPTFQFHNSRSQSRLSSAQNGYINQANDVASVTSEICDPNDITEASELVMLPSNQPVITNKHLIQTSDTSALHQPLITNEVFDRVIRGRCRTTYQMDFSGGNAESASRSGNECASRAGGSFYGADDMVLSDPRDKAQYSLDSMTRSAYVPPSSLPQELSVPVSRFASNRTKGHAAFGTLPGVINPAQMQIISRTTYDRDVNDRATKLYGLCKDIRVFGRKYGAEALRKALDRCSSAGDRENVERILQEMERLEERRNNPMLAENVTCEGPRQPTPVWVSRWSGPN